MKRFISLTIAALMLIGLCACGSSSEGTVTDGTAYASIEELGEAANFAVIRPDGVKLKNESFCILEGEPQVAQYSFTVDGVPCSLRFANTGIENDISGVKAEGGSGLLEGSEAENYYIENDELKAQRWFSVDGQYVFIAFDKSEWDWTQFSGIMNQFADLEPKNWNADTPYSEYLKIRGIYSCVGENGESMMGAVNIHYDHAAVIAYRTDENGETNCWEMEAELRDGKLYYDKETIYVNKYDEETGKSTEEYLPDGGAGYVVADGSSLDFSGAYSPELKGAVMVPMFSAQ